MYDVGQRSHYVSIRMRPTSKAYNSNVLKLAIDCASKKLSLTTMNKADKIRKKVSMGKKSAASLVMLDDKLKGCFLQFLEASSIDIFKEIIRCVQKLYYIEIPNLSRCIDRCLEIHGKCSPHSTNTEELHKLIRQYSAHSLRCV